MQSKLLLIFEHFLYYCSPRHSPLSFKPGGKNLLDLESVLNYSIYPCVDRGQGGDASLDKRGPFKRQEPGRWREGGGDERDALTSDLWSKQKALTQRIDWELIPMNERETNFQVYINLLRQSLEAPTAYFVHSIGPRIIYTYLLQPYP